MILHAFYHVGDADVYAADVADRRNDAQGQAIFIGVDKAAAEVAARRVAGDHPGSAFVALEAEAFVNDVFAEVDDFFNAYSYVFRVQFLFHAQLLCQQGVYAVGQYDDVASNSSSPQTTPVALPLSSTRT